MALCGTTASNAAKMMAAYNGGTSAVAAHHPHHHHQLPHLPPPAHLHHHHHPGQHHLQHPGSAAAVHPVQQHASAAAAAAAAAAVMLNPSQQQPYFPSPAPGQAPGPAAAAAPAQVQAAAVKAHHHHHHQHSHHLQPHLDIEPDRPIGYGAFGVVWSVTDPRDGKRVALKKMPNVFQNLVSCKRVFRELKMLCFFKHDNVSPISSLSSVLSNSRYVRAVPMVPSAGAPSLALPRLLVSGKQCHVKAGVRAHVHCRHG
ncbi:Serine/threonine-protein kinase NLK2 [Triplophysa tibetana]|uniref:Serine/threonine-protein kinase NLK2 n=1 Tax=Triplophysa tibetana TaxID=1572043 RepID=A0A5A9MYY4_9TELE|nr:Serine/threonine-protein kinase NLK2 [Triplophysa tibetana]